MGTMSMRESVKNIPLFEAISEGELDALCGVLELRRVRKGQRVLKVDEPGQFIMFLLSGRLNVVNNNVEGREVIIDTITPGDFFGELSLLTGLPRSANVEAAEDGEILVLAQVDFERHILSNPGLTRALLKELALRLRGTSQKASNLVLMDVFRRLAFILASLGRKEKAPSGDFYLIEERPTHKDLAAMVGTSREMVTRALKQLEEAGHITVDGKEIRVVSFPG